MAIGRDAPIFHKCLRSHAMGRRGRGRPCRSGRNSRTECSGSGAAAQQPATGAYHNGRVTRGFIACGDGGFRYFFTKAGDLKRRRDVCVVALGATVQGVQTGL